MDDDAIGRERRENDDRLREKDTHEEPAVECLTSSALNSIVGGPALGSVCSARRALCGCCLGRLGSGRGGRRRLRRLALRGRGRGEVVGVMDGHGWQEKKGVDSNKK